MDRISAYTSTADDQGQFTEGDPSAGVEPTEVTQEWLNQLQEEAIEILKNMGLSPESADWTQLWQALLKIYGRTYSGNPNGNLAADVLRERAWDTSVSPAALYIATAADGTTGGTTWTPAADLIPYKDESTGTRYRAVVVDGALMLEEL